MFDKIFQNNSIFKIVMISNERRERNTLITVEVEVSLKSWLKESFPRNNQDIFQEFKDSSTIFP